METDRGLGALWQLLRAFEHVLQVMPLRFNEELAAPLVEMCENIGWAQSGIQQGIKSLSDALIAKGKLQEAAELINHLRSHLPTVHAGDCWNSLRRSSKSAGVE